jgi:hypothetical protein
LSYEPRDVLRAQIGNHVLINHSNMNGNKRRYIFAKIEDANDLFYEACFISESGNIERVNFQYINIGGILIPEKNLPRELIKRGVYY